MSGKEEVLQGTVQRPLMRIHEVLGACMSILQETLSREKLAALLLFSLAGSLLPAIVVYVNKWIIDAAEGFSRQEISIEDVLWCIALYAATGLMLAGITNVRDRFAAVYFSCVADQLQENIMRKSSRIRLAYYDDIAYRNKVSFSSNDLPLRLRELIVSCVVLVQDILTILSLLATVLAINSWVALLVLLGFLPMVWVILQQGRANFRFMQEIFAQDNQRYYLHTVTYRRKHLENMRYYGLRQFVEDKWEGISRELNQKRSRITIKFFRLRLLANGVLYLSVGIGIVLVLSDILKGKDSIGSIALILTAITSLTGRVTVFFERLGILEENGQYVESYRELMSFEDEIPGTRPLAQDIEIRFEHVSFTYPCSDREVLHDLNLTIRQGERIAVVGENGSGKSTFASLLSGFYPIAQGRIMVNGVPLQECLEDFREKTSCLHQFSESYIMTVRENIEIGDTKREISRQELEELGRKVGVDSFIGTLENGYDTLIGNLSNNNTFDLSGGQRQKMFLARALARRNARLLILDEPTSALDPMSEAELYRNFSELAGDRTCILISHRLGATKLANRILVFRDGQIIEEGTHDSLIAQNGYYKQMYAAQAQWYR